MCTSTHPINLVPSVGPSDGASASDRMTGALSRPCAARVCINAAACIICCARQSNAEAGCAGTGMPHLNADLSMQVSATSLVELKEKIPALRR